jgi:hypothetical protein
LEEVQGAVLVSIGRQRSQLCVQDWIITVKPNREDVLALAGALAKVVTVASLFPGDAAHLVGIGAARDAEAV